MVSIGEFSNICKVSTKTLRYYAEIGLLLPDEINPETGYRYYSIKQLETMLCINRLKAYNFSLDEIKSLLETKESQDEILFQALTRKEKDLEKHVQESEKMLTQLHDDIENLKQGKSVMSYLENIDVQLVEVPKMYLLSKRKMVQAGDFAEEYGRCFGKLFRRIADDNLTICASPMVLFHSAEFSSYGLDTEFAIPIQEYVTGTRDFCPRLCLKTILQGSYSGLSSI